MNENDGLRFTKAHGTGNDFVVLADLDDALDLSDELVRALCDRRFGVGADGVLRIGSSSVGDVFMDYRNADGSIVEMCGNGVRVVAKYVLDHGLVAGTGDSVKIDTRSGVKPVTAKRGPDGKVTEVTVDMGIPTVEPGEWLAVLGRDLALVPVGIGNPHAVLLIDDVAQAPVDTVGPAVEHDARFPEGVNVEFAHVRSRGEVDLRVWERGVGETAACGTGACATQAALFGMGLVDDDVIIHLPGGDLRVQWSPEAGGVLMTGPAVEVAHGFLDPAWVAAAQHREVVS